jgi:pyruvate formate lyase activating enzyme
MFRHPMSRRQFLQAAARAGLTAGGAGLLVTSPEALVRLLGEGSAEALAATDLQALIRQAPVARYWVSTLTPGIDCASCHAPGEVDPHAPFDHGGQGIVRCLLCAQRCLIEPGERGHCRARINVNGELRTLVYGRPITIHVDPIEKKPFYHFLPGQQAFSLATSGCPLRCKFCQNWEISQARPEDYDSRIVPPADLVDAARDRQAPIVAFTYNEPTVFTEYLTDIARLARTQGVHPVLVSCGFMNEEPLTEMCEVLDAIKIDLKGYADEFYHEVCGAALQPVLRSIAQVSRSGTHLELVNLVVPTLNDSDIMLTELAKWVAGELGPDVPVHFTRFHPDYQLQNLPPTPVATLERARAIALAQGLHYPYVGNVPGHPGNNTYCPGCGQVVIERQGFFIRRNDVVNGHCRWCGQAIAGVWS